MPVSSAAVIAASIVTSLTTAGATAVQELQSGNTYIGGVVVNKTDFDFDLIYFNPFHGSWLETSQSKLSSMKSLREDIESDDSVTGDEDEIKTAARNILMTRELGSHLSKLSGQGEGMGFLSAVAFLSKEDNYVVCIYMKKKPGGSFTAAVHLQDYEWYMNRIRTKEGNALVDNGTLYMELIENHEPANNCGTSTGASVHINHRGIQVKFAAGKITEFEITERDYTPPADDKPGKTLFGFPVGN